MQPTQSTLPQSSQIDDAGAISQFWDSAGWAGPAGDTTTTMAARSWPRKRPIRWMRSSQSRHRRLAHSRHARAASCSWQLAHSRGDDFGDVRGLRCVGDPWRSSVGFMVGADRAHPRPWRRSRDAATIFSRLRLPIGTIGAGCTPAPIRSGILLDRRLSRDRAPVSRRTSSSDSEWWVPLSQTATARMAKLSSLPRRRRL